MSLCLQVCALKLTTMIIRPISPLASRAGSKSRQTAADSFNLLTPKLGFIWQDVNDSDIALYANYARGQRAPQASDLYRLQSLQTPGEIKTETLDSFEIGARGGLLDGALEFDLAAYSMDKRNFFFRDADGLNVPGGKTRHAGVELAFDWAVIPDALRVSGAASWSDHTYAFNRPVGRAGESITSGNQIDTAPEWLGDLQLVWTPTDPLTLTFGAEHVGTYFTDAENTRIPIPAIPSLTCAETGN